MAAPRHTRPRLPEVSEASLRARREWNGSSPGKGRAPRGVPVVQQCTADGCGTPVAGPPPVAQLVSVTGSKDGAAAHWYCPGRCAGIGRALADLRGAEQLAGGECR